MWHRRGTVALKVAGASHETKLIALAFVAPLDALAGASAAHWTVNIGELNAYVRINGVDQALSEPAREWRGLSLIEMARGWLEGEGVRVRGL